MTWDEAYLRTKWHLDPSSRLVTIDVGRKLGDCSAPLLGDWVLSKNGRPKLGHVTLTTPI